MHLQSGLAFPVADGDLPPLDAFLRTSYPPVLHCFKSQMWCRDSQSTCPRLPMQTLLVPPSSSGGHHRLTITLQLDSGLSQSGLLQQPFRATSTPSGNQRLRSRAYACVHEVLSVQCFSDCPKHSPHFTARGNLRGCIVEMGKLRPQIGHRCRIRYRQPASSSRLSFPGEGRVLGTAVSSPPSTATSISTLPCFSQSPSLEEVEVVEGGERRGWLSQQVEVFALSRK